MQSLRQAAAYATDCVINGSREPMHTPTLDELLEIMRSHRVESDPARVAAVVLEIYPVDDIAELRKMGRAASR
jgi:hypothetical protein